MSNRLEIFAKIRQFFINDMEIKWKAFPFNKNGFMESFKEVEINQHSSIVPTKHDFCSII